MEVPGQMTAVGITDRRNIKIGYRLAESLLR
jgi:hypothetical protein